MSPNKTLYIRDDDMPLWERAEQAAKLTRQSLSQLVTSALHRHLPSVDAPDDTMHDITVEVGDGERGWTETFTGRWLLAPDEDETRSGEPGADLGAYWGVALTRRGRIAVYVAHCNERWPARLLDYDNLEQAAEVVPADIVAMAAAELGQDRPIRRDI